MDEFSAGKCLHSEKRSNAVKKSSKKVQLRPDVKLKIKQRLQRDRGERKQASSNTGAASTPEIFTLPQPSIKSDSNIAKTVEKLWNMKKTPQLCSHKFVYAGRVPCFLPRNINKVDKKKRTEYTRRHRQHKKLKEKYCFWLNRRPKVQKQNSTKEFYFRFKHRRSKRPASESVKNKRAKRLCLQPDYDESMSGAKKQSFEPVKTKHKAQNKTDKKLNRDLQGQTTGKTHKHHIQRIVDRKNSEISSKEVEKSRQNEKNLTKVLRISLIDCFANGLRTKQNSGGGPFQTTSTPKPARMSSDSHEVSISHITPRIPTSLSPSVPTSYFIPKVKKSYVTTTFPKSDIAAMVSSWNITPPESAESCTEDERSIFSEEKEFARDKFRYRTTDITSKRNAAKIVYKPLFSIKPRFWKSVVVENDG